ncbi:MAG: transglutaminase-like domain-containing protein [Eubacteriales bacterium]|nr:transglutaminase-like domain-containing protein [Eubacteriales bacterium]
MKTVSLQRKEILEYYRSAMPYCDKTDVPQKVLEAYAEHALFLREQVEWCRELPEDVFLENVAAYRINSERIEDCRRFFYEMVMPLLEGLSLKEAILKVNLWCAANATYHQADFRTANAMTVYKSGFGRCGEESTFAVTVFRSVGIAARQVYAPLWSHCDDNHAWVEVYCDGRWQYLGACEPEPVLNRGWFDLPASKAMLVHARSFGVLEEQKDVIARNGCVTYYNVTEHYAKTADVTVTVKKASGELVCGVWVNLEVLNYAHFGKIATLRTDGDGKVFARLGIGSVRISCMLEGGFFSCLLKIEENGELEALLAPVCRDLWTEQKFMAPAGGVGDIEDAQPEDFVAFQQEIERAKAKREERISSYYDAARAQRFPKAQELLRAAGGNFEEVIRFLETDGNPYRLKMLKSLTQKDYYDLKAEVLEEHLACTLRYAGRAEVPEEIFVDCLLNPRLEFEELSCWRKEIRELLGDREAEFGSDPEKIWRQLCVPIEEPKEDAYDTLRMRPLAVLQGGRGSRADQKNLFLAVARTYGIPARLNPVTKEAEYYRDGAFYPADTSGGEPEKKSRIVLLANGEKNWTYLTDWSMECLEKSGYRLLDLHREEWSSDRLVVEAKPGEYRITTSIRLINGDQLETELFFTLGPEEKTVPLRRHSAYKDADMGAALPETEVRTDNGTVTLNALRNGRRGIYVWIREGEEPTEHILNEMLERISDVKNCQERIFLLSEKPPKTAGTLKRLMEAVPDVKFYLVDSFEDARRAAAAMGAETKKYPLALVANEEGKGIYVTCGYNVGAVAQMLMRI